MPSDNIRLVTERTMAEVLREVEDFLRTATRQDTLLLYYSGHGVLDQSNELFLCTRDTRTDRLRSTAVKASDVRQMIDESSAPTTVIILDCCHSGRFKGGDVPATLAGRGRFVLASSRSGELANDTDVRNHASLFTHHLVQGLLSGAEDRDGDGVVSLSELYDYVHGALTQQGRQVPQKRFEGDGDVPIALRPATTVQPQPDLIDPAVVEPELDVPETSIDLGEIDSDEVLPAERIAVVNRGGGQLAWTVSASAEWVVPEVEGTDVVLHLSPQPGPNRANVFIRDTRSGVIKTVRVSVRVRSAASGSASAQSPVMADPSPPGLTAIAADEAPAPAPPPTAEPELSEPAGAPAGRGLDVLRRRAPVVVGAVAVLAGALLVISALYATDAIEEYSVQVDSDEITEGLLRERIVPGPGLLADILGGGALVVGGVMALVRRLRLGGLGAVMALGVVLGSERLMHADSATSDPGCQCLGPWFGGPGTVALLAGAFGAVALAWRGAWVKRGGLSIALVSVGAVAMLLWGLLSASDLFEYYDEPFGSIIASGGSDWFALMVAAAVAGVVASYFLVLPAAAGALVGVAAFPAFAAISDIIWATARLTEDGYVVGWGVVLLVVPAVAVAAVAVLAVRRARVGTVSGGELLSR